MTKLRLVSIVAVWMGCVAFAAQAAAVEVRVPKEEKPRPPQETGPTGPAPALKELKPGLLAADLSPFVNSDGISDAANRSDADFDQWRQSFDADELPNAGTFEPKGIKTAFLFPVKDVYKKNNVACRGQKIPLEGKAKELHLLVTATDGDHEEKLTIEYADGEATADLKVTDWCKAAAFGEKPAIVCPSRVAVDAGGQGVLAKEEKETHIWVVAVPLDPQRELKSVALPSNSCVHVFALTLAR